MARGKRSGRGGGGGQQNGRGGGGEQQNGRNNGGQQKYCKICQRNGHTTQECYSNKNNNNSNKNSNGGNGQGNTNGQQNNRGGKYCSNCDMRNHNTEDCSKKGNNNNNNNDAQNQNQGQIQTYGAYQTPQVPDFNGQPIVFNDPCQICSQRGHIARECPNHASFIPPHAGTYFPQIYREPPAIPAPYQPPQQQWQQQWQQPTQNQSYQSNPSSAMEQIAEEVARGPLHPPYVRFVQEPARQGWQFGYIPPELACERPRMQDKDGDLIMADSWECGECSIPARQDDGMQRWASAPCQQPQQQGAWGSYY
ncbi:hypothetical protein F5882DRAFT_464963 [Hyaloscypha sp. PMI_1271]|nr:hypothetical protein F5882DRAFT_464963 [Hyaloscypha sp. PMI_1271]